jgi:glucokinase
MTNPFGLIADIGATNARFALVGDQGFFDQKILKCSDFPTIVDAVKSYLGSTGGASPQLAAIAVAGPVSGDIFEMTNNPWRFSIEQTKKDLGIRTLTLFNDFQAIAMGIPFLAKEDIVQIGGQQMARQHGTIGVIGPGTGLGVAGLFWNGTSYITNPCEGGHVTMPAKTQREFDLFRTLRYKYSHVSAERVCSGKGLVNIYNAIRILDGHEKIPDRTPEDIAKHAIEKTCPVCEEALDKMVGFLGTVSGDLALSLGAFGGIYIAGGIPAKLGEYFFQSRFRDDFEAKGRFKDYLKQIPTYLITHPYTAFVGLSNHLMRDRV